MTTPKVDPNWLASYPPPLLAGLAWLLGEGVAELYASGGVVRDWLRGRVANDLDLAVPRQAMEWARRLAAQLGGSYVPLDEREDVARVVWREFVIDFSGFREGSQSIAEDLGKRDFTVNAMAVRLQLQDNLLQLAPLLLDPLGGYPDLVAKQLRPTSPEIFRSDPLRLLRAYRFMAQADFAFTPGLARLIRASVALLPGVSVERINYELELILAAEPAPRVLGEMRADGLWPYLFPELAAGGESSQTMAVATFSWLTKIEHDPERYFPNPGGMLYPPSPSLALRWAGLLHGLVGPLAPVAQRLRWSREQTRRVGGWLAWQSWPAAVRHLDSSALLLAGLKLVKALGADWPGVFYLAQAVERAGGGPSSSWLAALFAQLAPLVVGRIQPLLASPPLLSGHDLQARLALPPGPLLGRLLLRLEEERLLNPGLTEAEAESLLTAILAGGAI